MGRHPWIIRAGHVCALWFFLIAAAANLHAHPGYLTSAVAKVQRDGQFTVDLTFDALAFALNDVPERIPDSAMNALLDGPRAELDRQMTAARRRYTMHFQVEADERVLPIEHLSFPNTDDVLRWNAAGKRPRLPVLLTCTVTGHLPRGTRRVAFSFPELIGNVLLVVERPGMEPETESLSAGQPSSALALHLGDLGASVTVDEKSSARAPSPGSSWSASDPATESHVGGTPCRAIQSVLPFIRMGFEHILPRGMDHVLFVIGLFLLGGRISALLWQVTAFTVAHSVTLGLAMYGVICVPSHLIEPAIALSIALVAADNLRGGDLRWWRVAVVFAFGLVHGLGFAGALRDMALPPGKYLPALCGFNLGVELGQLVVVAGAFLLVGWFRSRRSYRAFVVTPASLLIASLALVWTVQRIASA